MAEEIIRSNQSGEVTMRIWRGDEEGGEFAEYVMPAQEGEVVLDVIHRVQATEAPDLACRWNCKAGKCGSCSAEINGRPSLMCMTRMVTSPRWLLRMISSAISSPPRVGPSGRPASPGPARADW